MDIDKILSESAYKLYMAIKLNSVLVQTMWVFAQIVTIIAQIILYN